MRSAFKSAARKPGLSLIVICVLSIALGFSIAANLYHHQPRVAVAAPAGMTGDWRTSFEDIAEKLSPSVVNITSEKYVDRREMMPNMDDFFAPFGLPKGNAPDAAPQKDRQVATGSGVIVRPDGYILTNNHVVADADRVTVQLADGRELKGKVLRDPETDLAVVKIDATGLPAAQLADSDKVKVGQWSVAIGNPFGLKNTVTVGVISAFRKDGSDAPVATEVIQTDASINPGNSGGPLVDLDGRVIGINFMIISKTGANNGIGFAIPSNTAKFVMTQLIEKGKVVRGYLGVNYTDLTPVKADKFGAKYGAVVENVIPDSPAAKAGLQVKDVITKVNDKEIRNGSDLRNSIQSVTPGTTLKLTVIREKQPKTINVKLEQRTDEVAQSATDAGGDKTGLSVQPLTQDLADQLGLDKGTKGVIVRAVEQGSAAERAGIQPKDVITEIDDAPVTSVASFSKAVSKLKSGETAIVVVQREKRSLIVEMPMD